MDIATQLLVMASGARLTQMLHVAAELGVADQLTDDAASAGCSVEELAAACRAHPDTLFRLLRGLASVGVFTETSPRTFALSPLAQLLRSDHQYSLRQCVRMVGEEHYLSLDGLLQSVRTGMPCFRDRYGCSMFEHYQSNPRRGEIFDGAMTELTRSATPGLLTAYPFDELELLVDVGGGRGELLKAVLEHYPNLRGIVFDQPFVVEGVEIPDHLQGRLAAEGGDFFQTVPEGADAYLMKQVIHDWDDERCLQILGQIRKAMLPSSRLLILEQVIPEGNDPSPGKLLDINMLVMTEGGRERTPVEYAQLFEKAGLELRNIIPTPTPFSVVEAVLH